ncbi:MAG: NUDIX domain-containing protein [Anaerolineae bacterium]|jgi:8-oxo-dGTP pyrophosphatase MutT (NUDIX family)
MDLSEAFPELGALPQFEGKKISLVGVSAILYDAEAYYFEVGRPRFWARRASGVRSVGIGGIGGRVEVGEGPTQALRREVREEIKVEIDLDVPPRTALLDEGKVAAWWDLSTERKRPVPYFISLFPPRLGGPRMPDHLAIVTFLGRPRGRPRRGDLFGLVTVARASLTEFLEPVEWPLEDAINHPSLAFDLAGELPPGAVLRPKLSARAFQVLVRAGHHSEPGR